MRIQLAASGHQVARIVRNERGSSEEVGVEGTEDFGDGRGERGRHRTDARNQASRGQEAGFHDSRFLKMSPVTFAVLGSI
jgi:hypothetical protein